MSHVVKKEDQKPREGHLNYSDFFLHSLSQSSSRKGSLAFSKTDLRTSTFGKWFFFFFFGAEWDCVCPNATSAQRRMPIKSRLLRFPLRLCFTLPAAWLLQESLIQTPSLTVSASEGVIMTICGPWEAYESVFWHNYLNQVCLGKSRRLFSDARLVINSQILLEKVLKVQM